MSFSKRSQYRSIVSRVCGQRELVSSKTRAGRDRARTATHILGSLDAVDLLGQAEETS
jgi:hypothetical protein